MEDILIVGSGIAGLSAGLYAGRYELKTKIVGTLLGGATTTAWTIENYPGYLAIDGFEMIQKVKEQVENVGGEIISGTIKNISRQGDIYHAELEDGQTIEAKSVILAGGAKHRHLGVAKEDEFAKGKGVHYCLTCDGPMYKGKTIAVVGGGDAAVKGLMLATKYADKIYVVTLADKLTAEKINLKRIEQFLGNKIEVIYQDSVDEILGEDRVNGLKLKSGQEIKVDGIFVEIGTEPDKSLPSALGVELDDKGYIQVDNMMRTNIEGVYACGDACNHFGPFKQDITAAAMGAVAATSAFQHLQK